MLKEISHDFGEYPNFFTIFPIQTDGNIFCIRSSSSFLFQIKIIKFLLLNF